MHHLKLKKLVAENSELIATDEQAAIEKLTAEGLTPEEVTEVIEKSKEAPSEKPKSKEAPSEKNYAIHKCEPIKKDNKWVLDDEGNYTFDKKDHVRDVNITDYQAEILNSQSFNSKVRYYKK